MDIAEYSRNALTGINRILTCTRDEIAWSVSIRRNALTGINRILTGMTEAGNISFTYRRNALTGINRILTEGSFREDLSVEWWIES